MLRQHSFSTQAPALGCRRSLATTGDADSITLRSDAKEQVSLTARGRSGQRFIADQREALVVHATHSS